MSKERYVIASAVTTGDQDKRIAAALTAAGCGYWHWLPGTWLVIDNKGRGHVWMRDLFYGAAPVHVVVVPAGRSFASRLPPNMVEWIRDSWMKE